MADSAQDHCPQPHGDPKDTRGDNKATVSSPTRSEESSDGERGVVREKLKETRIDGRSSEKAQSASNQPSASEDTVMNGVAPASRAEEQGTSGSENGGRSKLQRKRSFDEYEEEELKGEDQKTRHERKKSRDASNQPDEETAPKGKGRSGTGKEGNDEDEVMQSFSHGAPADRQSTPEAQAALNEVTSPKSKRLRQDNTQSVEAIQSVEKSAKPQDGADDGRHPEHHQNKSDTPPSDETKSTGTTKIPPGSGFANTSSVSPFAAVSPPPNTTETAKDQRQTSDDKFKKSGFGSFAKAASPLTSFAASGSASPFGGASPATKLSSFASPPAASAPPASGFGALGASTSSFGSSALGGAKSAFGGALGGSSFGGGFGGITGAKPGSGMSSFAKPGASGITGLKAKPTKPFGAPKPSKDDSDEEDGGDEDDEGGKSPTTEAAEDRQDSRFYEQEIETGEENEEALFTGRAKLYSFVKDQGWKERGFGPLKLNVTKDTPKKARLLLRENNVKRVILNVAVDKSFKIGNATGEEPREGKLFFIGPKDDGSKDVEQKLLRIKEDAAKELYHAVRNLKAEL